MVESSNPPSQTTANTVSPAGADLRVRRAVPDDARAIAVVSTLGWQRAYRGILPDEFLALLNADSREKAWRAALESESGDEAPVWVAERSAETVGFVSSGPSRDDDLPAGAIEVYAIYVLPRAWRSGVGRSLLGTATRHAGERGVVTLTLWVLEANVPARRFYEAMGWRPDGARQMFELRDVSAPELRYRLNLDATSKAASGQRAEPPDAC